MLLIVNTLSQTRPLMSLKENLIPDGAFIWKRHKHFGGFKKLSFNPICIHFICIQPKSSALLWKVRNIYRNSRILVINYLHCFTEKWILTVNNWCLVTLWNNIFTKIRETAVSFSSCENLWILIILFGRLL